MQQVESLRKRWDTRGQWMQIGLASATLLAPMAKRWNDLRTVERTRELREEAEARFGDVRDRMRQMRAPEWLRQTGDDSDRAAISSKLWLAGVALGLVAAGTVAYVIVRRRMSEVLEEPMVDLATVQMNGHAPALREVPRMAEQPASVPGAGGQATSAAMTSGTTTATGEEAEAAQETIEHPQYIGNIHTMVYHDAGEADLPTAENQIFFGSEEEAERAGYHRDRREIPPPETETSQQG